MAEERSDRTEEAPDLVIAEVEVDAPIDAVWRALREPAEIRRWHGWDTEDLDEEIEFIYLEHGEPDAARHTLDIPGVGARFSVRVHGNGVVVRITKPGVTPDDSWDEIYDEVDQGWVTFLHQLRFALERRPSEERRAVRIDVTRPITLDDLGLGDAARLQPGDRCRGLAPWGAPIEGEIWFRTRHQLGLALGSGADGLVVLHDEPDRGVTFAIVTTYPASGSSASTTDDWRRALAPAG